MSCWSYITGWVQVQPMGRTQEEKEYILKTVLNHLPVVQGSEEDMYVHIIKAGGYDISHSGDEYGFRTNNLKIDGYGEPYRNRHGWMKMQSTYYLLVEGHLRDTYYPDAYRQIIKWLTRLAKRVIIDDVDLVYSNSWVDKPIRISGEDFYQLYETPTWGRYKDKKYVAPYQNYDTNWCEHLMWEE